MSNYNDKFIRYDNFVINKFDSQFITIRMLNDIKITLKKTHLLLIVVMDIKLMKYLVYQDLLRKISLLYIIYPLLNLIN